MYIHKKFHATKRNQFVTLRKLKTAMNSSPMTNIRTPIFLDN
jgi:hypothetical protein